MKKIALFCVSYLSDKERDNYLASVDRAARKAQGEVTVDFFVANNTKENNPGYFGAIRQLMQNVDLTSYDYSIVSNVDLTMEEDFFLKLSTYHCEEDTGWIAPQIWSELEGRDRNPGREERISLKKLQLLKWLYKYPRLNKLYTDTLYRRRKFKRHSPGEIYAGHGSFIILTRHFFQVCGIINYPVFLFCEELYLAEECRKHGLKVVYVPDIKVKDTEHVSTKRIDNSYYCHLNNIAVQFIIDNYYFFPNNNR